LITIDLEAILANLWVCLNRLTILLKYEALSPSIRIPECQYQENMVRNLEANPVYNNNHGDLIVVSKTILEVALWVETLIKITMKETTIMHRWGQLDPCSRLSCALLICIVEYAPVIKIVNMHTEIMSWDSKLALCQQIINFISRVIRICGKINMNK
jgi:hypothetical protein